MFHHRPHQRPVLSIKGRDFYVGLCFGHDMTTTPSCIYTPHKRSLGGYIGNTPSVCPSVRFLFRAITSVNIIRFYSYLADILYIGIPWMGLLLVVVRPWPWPQVTLKCQKYTFSQISSIAREIEFIFVLYTYRKSYMGFHLLPWPLTWGQGQRSQMLFSLISWKL